MKTNTPKILTSEEKYNLQVKQIIQTLSDDLPTLFERDINYDIYTENIEFRDPISRFKGKFNYRIIFWTLRFHARLFFTDIYFDVHQIETTPKDDIIVDWTVRGTLRLPWQAKVLFNGNSTYKLTEAGLIYEHCDRWDRSPWQILKQFFKSEVIDAK
ncbi:DUF2358 domain-containing protein [Spirulina sp. 06S082]|uniref:DUF2358 domain-containing protein n=1 Tax=Spirulina sp. 06S082 TaxID=3110248 RepID=UPI002B204A3C|nr:DUF2358 domain-containing protein [Spirulina sp. 06S082]MEA5468106.1 DUF2358 domain-containing protein [Spirulina sp. 06S082]